VAITQEEFTTRINEIQRNLNRTYEEMGNDELITKRIEGSKSDNIRRLGEYYEQLYNIGAFVDPITGRSKRLDEICRTIQFDMKERQFTPVTRQLVVWALPDKYKRAWRKPITNDNNDKGLSSEEDDEVESIYDTYMDHINELDTFDYNELPKAMRQNIAERVYKLYKRHDKEWTKNDIHVVKHEDGLNIPDPYAGIIRIEKGKPYRGMAVTAIKKHIKLCKEIEKKYIVGVYNKKGVRRITLDQEKQLYNAWAAIDGYLKPWANDKWKRDFIGWCKVFKQRFKLKSKSGAAKFSEKKIFINGKWVMRGITREEIDKTQPRMCNAFMEFMEHIPALIHLHESFEWMAEPIRAAHSVELHDKLSQSS
jgi:hypothetical protein